MDSPWQTPACQASLSMGFSRQGYWSGLPFPSPKKRESKYKEYVLYGCVLRKVRGENTHWFSKSDVGEGMGLTRGWEVDP